MTQYEWYGEPHHPSLPQTPPNYYKTPTLTAAQLIEELQKLPPTMPVGTCVASIHGWVNGITRVTQDEHGLTILVLTEETLYTDEVRVN